MALRDVFRLTRAATETSPNGQASAPQIRSPWSTGQLSRIVWADVFGTESQPVTRREAMSVPAVAKARLLITALSSNPLRAYKGDAEVSPQPGFLYRTNTQVHPTVRMLWTLDDLIFGGWSLWAVERGTRGAILDAVRVPPEMWSFDSNHRVLVNEQPVKADEVILFSGPHEGLLDIAARTIRAARALEEAWTNRVKQPIPLMELRQVLDETMTDEEIDDLLAAYVAARKDPDGAAMFVPYGIEAIPHGDVKHELFVEARNAIRLDVGNFTGVPAALLDGSMTTASLTYSTVEGRRNEWLDTARAMWLAPIEARLSQDDVVPAGTHVAFDLSALLTLPPTGTGPTRED